MMMIMIITIMIAFIAGSLLVCFSAQCVFDFLFCPWFSFYVAVSLTLQICTNEKMHKKNTSYPGYKMIINSKLKTSNN